jgi:hypothetical protein
MRADRPAATPNASAGSLLPRFDSGAIAPRCELEGNLFR